jgi:hypothetical protein
LYQRENKENRPEFALIPLAPVLAMFVPTFPHVLVIEVFGVKNFLQSSLQTTYGKSITSMDVAAQCHISPVRLFPAVSPIFFKQQV